jgi:succinoglycan biosynthesis transport protein ExoP
MLDVSKTYASVPSETDLSAEQSASLSESLSIARSIAQRQWYVVALALAIAISAAIPVYLKYEPTYKATASVAIDTRRFQLFEQPASLGEVTIDSASAVESQVAILKSEKVLLRVIKKLLLDERQDQSQGWWRELFGKPAPLTDFQRTRAVLAAFQNSLTVTRPGIAWVIDITFESKTPDLAALVANTMADTYITEQLEAKYEATRQGSAWLEGRLKELLDQSKAAQRAVIEFKAKNNMVDAGDGRSIVEQQLADLNAQLAIARSQTAEMKSRLERVNAIERAASEDATMNASLVGVLSNDTLTKLRNQYSETTAREVEFAAKYGRNHLSVVNFHNQAAQIRAAMVEEVRRLGESSKSDYELALKREKNLESDLASLISQSEAPKRAQVSLRELETAAQTAAGLYDNALKRYKESLEQQALPVTEARVITSAVPPPTGEYKALFKRWAILFGGCLAFGFGIALFREVTDRVYRTVAQVERRLQANCIAVIPLVKRIGSERVGSRRKDITTTTHSRTIEFGHGPFRTVVDSPLSAYAEAMRTIKLAIDLNVTGRGSKVIGLTSSLPREGKSSISASLALAIGCTGSRVVILDCDLRNPALTRTLAPDAEVGLIEVLTQRMPLADTLWVDESRLISFLPAVVNSGFCPSVEIMNSAAAKACFDRLRKEYDYVIVDLPPLAPFVDVQATTHFVDSYLFVIEWGGTAVDVVDHALQRAPRVAENTLGVLLNKVDMKRLKAYDYKNASYYENKLYSQYGYVVE